MSDKMKREKDELVSFTRQKFIIRNRLFEAVPYGSIELQAVSCGTINKICSSLRRVY